MCGIVLLEQGQGLGCPSHFDCYDCCDGAASVGFGVHTGLDMDVVPNVVSRRGLVDICALGWSMSDS